MPLAYFITFSTYGTWLHGTDKGNGSVDRHHNAYGTPFVAPDDSREERAAHRMTDPPYVLHETARTIVRDAIIGLCKEKDWHLLALHVRTNHVHAVISADREPGRLMSDLKARASRDLNRAFPSRAERAAHEVSVSPSNRASSDTNAKRWTRHGSTRHLFDDASVAGAIDYVLNQQGPRMAYYDRNEQRDQGTAHEVIASPRDPSQPPLTSCAAPSRSAGREISGLNAYES